MNNVIGFPYHKAKVLRGQSVIEYRDNPAYAPRSLLEALHRAEHDEPPPDAA